MRITLAEHQSEHATPLGSLIPIGGPPLVVLDTNVIYNDIAYRLRHPGSRGVLLSAAASGHLRLFAAEHVYDEVYDRLGGFERRGLDRGDVVRCFETEYLPHVRFVAPPSSEDSRIDAVAAMDADDVPTAQLALLLAPSLVFTADRHLIDAGFAHDQQWLTLAFTADEIAGYDGLLVLGWLGIEAAGRRVAAGSRWFVADLSPRAVAVGIAVSILLVLAAPAASAKLAEATERWSRELARGAGHVGLFGMQVVGESGRGKAMLRAASVDPGANDGNATAVARALAMSPSPLGSGELARQLGRSEPQLEALLRSHNAFVLEPGGWTLGRLRSARAQEALRVTPVFDEARFRSRMPR